MVKILLLGILLSFSMTMAYSETKITEDMVVGLSTEELYSRYPAFNVPDASFLNLVSKNLHPYHIPPDHTFLRYGREYLVIEIKNGKVIALHRVHG